MRKLALHLGQRRGVASSLISFSFLLPLRGCYHLWTVGKTGSVKGRVYGVQRKIPPLVKRDLKPPFFSLEMEWIWNCASAIIRFVHISPLLRRRASMATCFTPWGCREWSPRQLFINNWSKQLTRASLRGADWFGLIRSRMAWSGVAWSTFGDWGNKRTHPVSTRNAIASSIRLHFFSFPHPQTNEQISTLNK